MRAGNNEIILTSEQYETKSGALNGIASVRKNAPDENRYVRKTATNGSPYFVLTAANGEIIGTSELYSTATARDNGISAVMKTAPDAPWSTIRNQRLDQTAIALISRCSARNPLTCDRTSAS